MPMPPASDQEAAREIELAPDPMLGQEPAHGKPEAAERGMAEDRDPDPGGGEDAVALLAHGPGEEDLGAVGEPGGGDADGEYGDGGAPRARKRVAIRPQRPRGRRRRG
jgi:hypothetical protein